MWRYFFGFYIASVIPIFVLYIVMAVTFVGGTRWYWSIACVIYFFLSVTLCPLLPKIRKFRQELEQ